jgi:2-polyprenyl-6-methoxyphenol hydroxylase-like FAD-dependent oxidoreductase
MALTHCHVIVIGAGIGGLTAALSLQRYGFKVSVYEQASELREFGAGLPVTPNAVHALEFLGVGEEIAATSNVSNELLIRHFQSGKIIHRRPDGHYYKSKYGAGHFQVHRADLHNALKAAVLASDPDCVHLAHVFSSLVQLRRIILHSSLFDLRRTGFAHVPGSSGYNKPSECGSKHTSTAAAPSLENVLRRGTLS